MKNLIVLIICGCLIFSSCQTPTTQIAAEEQVTLPVELSYTGKPAIGSMKNVQVVLEWNKRLSEKNFELADLLADSVTVHLADGTDLAVTRDSLITIISGFIGAMQSLEIKYVGAVPVNNVDKNHEWVFSWTEETYTYPDGKIEKTFLHEDYRLENGKIREAYQYARKPPVTDQNAAASK